MQHFNLSKAWRLSEDKNSFQLKSMGKVKSTLLIAPGVELETASEDYTIMRADSFSVRRFLESQIVFFDSFEPDPSDRCLLFASHPGTLKEVTVEGNGVNILLSKYVEIEEETPSLEVVAILQISGYLTFLHKEGQTSYLWNGEKIVRENKKTHSKIFTQNNQSFETL